MSWAQGDFNGDGVVNVSDLTVLASYYGRGSMPGAALVSFQEAMGMFPEFGGSGGVPKPGTLVVLGLASVGVMVRRRRSVARACAPGFLPEFQ